MPQNVYNNVNIKWINEVSWVAFLMNSTNLPKIHVLFSQHFIRLFNDDNYDDYSDRFLLNGPSLKNLVSKQIKETIKYLDCVLWNNASNDLALSLSIPLCYAFVTLKQCIKGEWRPVKKTSWLDTKWLSLSAPYMVTKRDYLNARVK